jgi:glycosyltransferase involved in cell wall biosynthesis
MGPTDEDEEYDRDCRLLVKMLELTETVKFLGRVDAKAYYPKCDVIVLTSVSEAQPLVILEANAAGIPCVATDVGACKELLGGRTEEDKLLGPSGLVTGISNAQQTSDAITRVLTEDGLWKKMVDAVIERVRQYYRDSDVWARYRNLYEHFAEVGVEY